MKTFRVFFADSNSLFSSDETHLFKDAVGKGLDYVKRFGIPTRWCSIALHPPGSDEAELIFRGPAEHVTSALSSLL